MKAKMESMKSNPTSEKSPYPDIPGYCSFLYGTFVSLYRFVGY